MNSEERLLRELEEIKTSDKQIILFGAGEAGLLCMKALEYLCPGRKIYFCDNDKELQGKLLLNRYQVFGMEDVQKRFPEVLFVVCVYRNRTVNEIKEFIQTRDKKAIIYQKESLIYYYTIFVMKRKVNSVLYAESICNIADIEEQNHISTTDIGLSITSVCDLRCKNCGYLLTYVDKRRHSDKNVLVENVKNLISAVGNLQMVTIVGGEPFLSPDLVWICEQISNISQIMIVRMVTNGRMIPASKIMEQLADKVTCIMISDYKELSKSKYELQEELQSRNILGYVGYRNTFNEWLFVGKPERLQRSAEEKQNRMQRCPFNKEQYYILDSKLFICGYSAWAITEGMTEDLTEDYLELDDIEEIRQKIHSMQSKCLQSCGWCKVNFDKYVPAGEQL